MKRSLVLSFIAVAAIWAADINGAWSADVPGRQGTAATTFNFKVEGAALTGTIVSQRGESREEANGAESTREPARQFARAFAAGAGGAVLSGIRSTPTSFQPASVRRK